MSDSITLTDAAEGRTLGPVTLAETPRMLASNLSMVAYSHGFTTWHYRHDGALRETFGRDFFQPARDLLTGGDLITVSALDGMAQIAVQKIESRITGTPMGAAIFPEVA